MSASPNCWILTGFVISAVGALALGFVDNVRLERRIYWSTWLVSLGVMTLGVTHRGWRTALVIYGVAAATGVLVAYFRTSYLKIGGRIYSYSIARTRPDPPRDGSPAPPVVPPPDSYRGRVTATAHWCLLVVFSVVAGASALMFGVGPETLGAGVLAVTMLAFTGYIDSYDGFPIARCRWVQLALIVVSSIPVFLLPPIAYLIAYYIDRPTRGP
ncbi:hypothetical protein V4U86_19010 [Mycobacterium sp. AMU20-3851]|uniref:hypothetical protein n=1 Tax=Mycobacterium sp. AMU20-3851 TaxID=3122055 RepID=UPI00375453A5